MLPKASLVWGSCGAGPLLTLANCKLIMPQKAEIYSLGVQFSEGSSNTFWVF